MVSNPESQLPPTSKVASQTDDTDVNSKCCEFCKAKLNGRNLILCFDGTSNQFGENNTNVIELYSRIIKDDSQLTYYNSGIGTYARPSWRSYTYWKQVLDNKIDLAIAWNFEKVVLAGYRWLSDNYMDGDKIFLFGFSRGAYQVRVLAGMINKVGLILRGNGEQIPFAYELYADLSPKRQEADKSSRMAQRFKTTFSRSDVRVHFIGVWDTVSSVGVIRGKSLPGTDNFNPNSICYFRHALALDERRVKFLPEYVCGGETYVDEGGSAISRVKEVWFAGCHSDIGGGSENNAELNNAAVPVLWMGNEALFAGLKLRNSEVVWKWDKLAETRPNESLVYIWHFFEFLPFKRLLYDQPGNTWWPHVWEGRVIKLGQKIHASVSFIKDYQSKAKFSPGMVEGDWSSVVNKGQQNNVRWMKGIENLLELDLFDYSNVKKIIDDGDVARLEFVALTREGRQAIADVDHEFKVLRNMLKDSDERRVATCVAILLKLATHSAARSALTETNLLQPLAGGSEVRIKRLESMRELLKYDDIRGNLSQGGIAEFLSSVIKSDSEAASEASRVLYGYVRYSDGREAFLNMITKESTFEWLLKNEIWHLLNVSYLLTHDTGRRIIDGDLKLPDVKNIQLLTPLKEFTGELLNDEHNADGLCRLVEHGFFERASANDAIQFLIGTIGMQPFALDVLAAFFKHPEVPGKIPESFLDRWINSLQAMVLGSNDAKQCSGLQALSICAGYSEMRKKIVEANITWRLIELFKSNDDSVRYCASLALITLDGGDPQPDIPAKEIIAWLVGTVGRLWRYRRTVKFLSEIIKNDRQKNLMPASIKDLNMLTQLPDSMSSTKIFVRPQDIVRQQIDIIVQQARQQYVREEFQVQVARLYAILEEQQFQVVLHQEGEGEEEQQFVQEQEDEARFLLLPAKEQKFFRDFLIFK